MQNQSNTKFQIDDYIIYGSSGVCVVKDICVPDMFDIDTTEEYYILEPVYLKGSTIYSPVDNSTTVMRKIITKEEAQELINQIQFVEPYWNINDKKREEQYKAAIRTYDCFEWIRIIKTLYQRKQELSEQKKRLGQIDERYLHMAEDLLYSELSIPLEMTREQVESYIADVVSQQESEKCQ
jgi:CarD family transcriptional regulator